jgi:hypothetical protein
MRTLVLALAMSLFTTTIHANDLPNEIRVAFEKAKKIELIAIGSFDPAIEKPVRRFHQWAIHGRTTTEDKVAQKVWTAVAKGVKDSDGSSKQAFKPDFGFRVEHEGKAYDLAISYSHLKGVAYVGEKKIGEFTTSENPARELAGILLDDSDAFAGEIPEVVRTAFAKAREFELLSLDPTEVDKKEKVDPAQLFHGWCVLGRTNVKDETARHAWNAIEKGLKDHPQDVEKCFDPRHGLRIVHEKTKYDLVICYSCHQACVYEGKFEIARFNTSGAPGDVLTKVLRDAGVPLPKPADK